MNEAYDHLIDSLNMRGGSVAAHKCDELYALLEEIFSADEAELFSKMPFGLATPEQIAQEAGKTPDETGVILEEMANKGLITSRDRAGKKVYATLPLVPGIFEFQLMKGGVSEQDKRLARLFEDYFIVARNLPRGEGKIPTVPFARVIPVEEKIKTGIEVFPYEQVSKYVDTTDHIAVSTCYCRHHGELTDNPCDRPKEVCMSFGPGAKFVAERGFGRLVSKEEAKKILDLSEEAGLVHCSSNTSDYIDFICNCCDCHCGIIQSMKVQQRYFGGASNFVVEVDEDSCVGCETCIDRCPMEAFSMKEDVVERDASKCIGCGLCVSTCDSEALKMVNRSDRQIPPRNHRELMTSMIASME